MDEEITNAASNSNRICRHIGNCIEKIMRMLIDQDSIFSHV